MNTTPTTEDRNRAKKDLEHEITKLIAVKDVETGNAKSAIESAGQARKSFETVDAHLKELLTMVPDVSRETREFITHCVNLLRESGAKVAEMTAMTAELAKEAERAIETLKIAKEDAGRIHETAVAEEALMQRQREDLDIYHERIKAYFAEYLPDQKVIL